MDPGVVTHRFPGNPREGGTAVSKKSFCKVLELPTERKVLYLKDGGAQASTLWMRKS